MAKYFKWIGIAAAAAMLAAAFMPWVVIESRNMTLTGVDTSGTNFGKPAYVHLVFTGFFLLFHLLPKLMAKRFNIVVVALNLAWAVRNYFIIAACQGGECPVRMAGLYLAVACSVLMLLAALFPDMEIPQDKKNDAGK